MATVLAALLLGSARRNVLATVARLDGAAEGGPPRLHFSFAVPGSYTQSNRDALEDAARAASVEGSSTADTARCLAAVYAERGRTSRCRGASTTRRSRSGPRSRVSPLPWGTRR